jgi:hypothetical protein
LSRGITGFHWKEEGVEMTRNREAEVGQGVDRGAEGGKDKKRQRKDGLEDR